MGVKQLTADPTGGASEEKTEAKPKAKAAKETVQVPDDGAATAGTTNLGALLKAKLDSKNNE